jgi:hypothetical protein
VLRVLSRSAEQSGLALVFESEALAVDAHGRNAKLIFGTEIGLDAEVRGAWKKTDEETCTKK